MRSVDEQVQHVLAAAVPLRPIDLRVTEADGARLSADATALVASPPYDTAASDGYAVRTADVASASGYLPVTLPVIGDVPAGAAPTLTVQPGLTARIAAGAPMPPGADAVVPAGWTDRGIAQVKISRSLRAGQGVRLGACDAQVGDVAVRAGTVLGPAEVALLAAVGRRVVAAHPKPRVVVLATGSELVEVGEAPRWGQLADITGPALSAAVRSCGAAAFRAPLQPDDARLLTDAVEDALIQADLLVTIGGIRAGGRGTLRTVLGRLGRFSCDEVAMMPECTIGTGALGPDATPVISLPGAPAVALVAFEVFVRPALRQVGGLDAHVRRTVRATLAVDLPAAIPGHRRYVPVTLQRAGAGWQAVPVLPDGGSSLPALSTSAGLAVLPEVLPESRAGTEVEVWLRDGAR